MPPVLEQLLPAFFGLAAMAYIGLAVNVSRSHSRYANSMVSFLLVLFAGMLAGSAFSYGAVDADFYSVGRALSFSSAGFLPVVFYVVYRQYTQGNPGAFIVVTLCIIPVISAGLAITNSAHEIIWTVSEVDGGLEFSNLTDHYWYNHVYAPFVFGLIGVTALAMVGQLSSIAAAHRRTVIMLLVGGMLPFIVSVANTFLGIGPPEFPFSSLTIALLWPFFAYFSLKMRVHEFSPIAYQTLFNHVRDPIFVVDSEQCIVCANLSAQRLLGCTENDMLGRKLWHDYPTASKILKQARELDLTQTLQIDNNKIYEVSVSPLTGPAGQDLGMVVVCRDVTGRRNAQRELADSEHLIRTLVETSSNGILRFSRDTDEPEQRFRCSFANRAGQEMVGEGDATLVGMPLNKLQQLNPGRLLEHFEQGGRLARSTSYEVLLDDDELWLRIVGESVGDDISLTLIDITQRKRNEEAMLADALRDPLTGLLNRRGFETDGVTALADESQGAVLYFDLNAFKSINDRFGHQSGDALLKAFGHRLEYCLRPEDVLGRLGGDEFAIVMPGVGPDDVRQIAQRLVQTASEAYIIKGQEITCTTSVGIALTPKHGTELWGLLSVADEAMYEAKSIPEETAANDCAAYIDAATAS
jgi:diguanylate cyclase (GGDEF)-like protein/PAS domain S-box-containing protein